MTSTPTLKYYACQLLHALRVQCFDNCDMCEREKRKRNSLCASVWVQASDHSLPARDPALRNLRRWRAVNAWRTRWRRDGRRVIDGATHEVRHADRRGVLEGSGAHVVRRLDRRRVVLRAVRSPELHDGRFVRRFSTAPTDAPALTARPRREGAAECGSPCCESLHG